MHARARLPEIDQHEADDQCQTRDDFEIDQRLDGDAPHPLCFAHARDAVHHRAEDDRSDQHPHELDEEIAERLQGVGALRPHITDPHAQRHRDENLQRQIAIDRTPAFFDDGCYIGAHMPPLIVAR